jgi:hypothetical protein
MPYGKFVWVPASTRTVNGKTVSVAAHWSAVSTDDEQSE